MSLLTRKAVSAFTLAAVPLLSSLALGDPTVWTPSDCNTGNIPDPPSEVDVIVAGGGFSGLMSAYHLQKQGLKTLLLEAKEAIGGRSRSHPLENGSGIVELGAAWINNSTQPDVYSLVEKFGLTTQIQYSYGDIIVETPDGNLTRTPYRPDPSDGGGEDDSAQEFLDFIDDAAWDVDLRDFSKFPSEQDVTFAEWIDLAGLGDEPGILAAASSISRILVGREADDVGAHYILDYVKSGRNLTSLNGEFSNGAQYMLVEEGTTAIATGLAKSMTEGSVLVDAPVVKVHQGDDWSTVKIKSGQTFKAKKVILAIPTNTYDQIEFSPELPCEKRSIVKYTKPGIYAKVVLSYEQPWWREAGLSGKFNSLKGPICLAMDSSIPSASQYSLIVLVGGDVAAEWLEASDSEKKKAIVDHLMTMAGEELEDQASDTLEINYVEWTNEDYIFGGPTTTMQPGQLRVYGSEFRVPFKNIHFGGGETAFEWKGYLEGAIRSGKRAAEEVVQLLDS